MVRNLARLLRYRGLIESLVARELKARYRGSVLGFFWSFVNPLLLLVVYSVVFKYILPPNFRDVSNYSLFMFCGILPWTWFTSSLLESSGVLISSGNLIKKVLFPAEILPIVTVLANMIHFALGLPILALFLIYFRAPITPLELLWFPVTMLVQLIFTLGCALVLSALTVHFRDIRDILGHLLTIWFFATPVIYPYKQLAGTRLETLLDFNPMSHLIITYQEILYFRGPVGHAFWLLVLGGISVVFFLFGYFVFDRLRDTFAEEV
jgi:ABC-type polysaccharide/polyol phosphate export permease